MTHGRTFVKAGPSAAAVRREAHLRCKEIGSEPAHALALTPRPVPRLPSCFAEGAHGAARPSAQGGSPRDRTSVRSHSGYRVGANIRLWSVCLAERRAVDRSRQAIRGML